MRVKELRFCYVYSLFMVYLFSFIYLLLLLFAVKFITKPKNTTVAVGKSTVLRCNASGTPEPDVSWGKERGGMEKKRFRQLTDGSLHIRDAHMADAGRYFCMAANSEDLKEIKVTLRVVGV